MERENAKEKERCENHSHTTRLYLELIHRASIIVERSARATSGTRDRVRHIKQFNNCKRERLMIIVR